MSERVSMPALGESVTEGTVTRWLKNIGDSVEVDEPLLEVSTDKVDTEIPSPVAGTLQEILAQEDDTVEVGADLCVIGEGEPSSGGDEGSSGEEAEQEEEPQEEQPSEDEPSEEAPQEDDSQGSDSQEAQDDSSSQDQSSGGSGGGEVSGGETVTMPALGESVTEGTVTRWLKSEGDQVEVDEPLLEVSTDKVDTEIPSPVAGVLTEIIAGEDETVEVGGELAVIGGESSDGGSAQDSGSAPADEPEESDSAAEGDDQEPAGDKEQAEESADSDLGEEQQVQEEAAQESASSSGAESSPSSEQDTSEAVGVGTPSPETGSSSHKQQSTSQDVSAYVTPLVRKLAAQHGVDLGSLQGTGVGGRIRKQDVLDAAKAQEEAAKAREEAAKAPAEETPEQAPAAAESAKAPAATAPSAPAGTQAKRGTTEKMSRLRKVIATRMVESLQTGAQLTTVVEVDVTKVSRLRKRVKDEFARREGTKLSFLPFFAMASIEALKEHPIVNSSVEDDTVIYHGAEHLGVAVDTPRGLLVPVIKDAGDLNIAGLARKIADLAERTRDNKINPDELSGGTFTLTNTGSRGALFDTPIINQPNVAILGTGTVVKRPVVVIDEDGMETIAVRDMVYLALTYDHRVVDGADAARFLATVKERLEDGSFEV